MAALRSRALRGLMGPVITLLVLFGIGYAVDVQDHSNPQHLTIEALSVKFVNNQGTKNISNWNMTVKNNGTISLIMGHLCQRNLESNNCDDLAPSSSGYHPWYLTVENTSWFMLTGVNTTYAKWELHVQFFAWPHSNIPSTQDITNVYAAQVPSVEWLSYDSTTNMFTQ